MKLNILSCAYLPSRDIFWWSSVQLLSHVWGFYLFIIFCEASSHIFTHFFLLFSCWVLRVFFNMYPGYIFFIGCNLQIFNTVFSFSWHHGFVWKGFLRKFILKILLSLFFHVEGGSEMPTLEFFKTFYFVLLLLLLLLLLSRFSRVWLCATP